MSKRKRYLQAGQQVFCTGAYLTLNRDGTWTLDSLEEEVFCEGELVSGYSTDPDDNNPYFDDINDEEE